jgi:hypothetical protein
MIAAALVIEKASPAGRRQALKKRKRLPKSTRKRDQKGLTLGGGSASAIRRPSIGSPFSRIALFLLLSKLRSVAVASVQPGRASGSTNMNWLTKFVAAGIVVLFATSAFAVDVQETIIMMHHNVALQMEGKAVKADIVKMHGHMYVMIPVDDLPDPLHQQVSKFMR